MDKIQLIFFFINGFLISRLIIKVKLPQRLIYILIGRKKTSITKTLLYLVSVSAFLSFFIPNAIVVLTLIPILELLTPILEKATGNKHSIATMLALSVIYGANIGGMGSITATPANGILVTYVEVNAIPGSGYLNFALWMAWGIPLVICFVFVAWLILISMFGSWRFAKNTIDLPFQSTETYHHFQKSVVVFTILYLVSSVILSILIMEFSDFSLAILIITVILTSIFIFFIFYVPLNTNTGNNSKEKLLSIKDCYSNLPTRGFLFVGVAVILAGILYLLEIHILFSQWIAYILPIEINPFIFLLVIAAVTSFATEILSNTAVQISMFLLILPLAFTLDFAVVFPLLVITLSCTCAFMSPIATGVNGLAFGGVRGVSLSRMLIVGSVMNVAGAALISFWILFVVGWLFRVN